MNRRAFLASAAGGVGVALAGCTDRFTNSVGRKSLPEYHTAIPGEPLGSDERTFAYIDWEQILEMKGFGEETDTPTPTEDSSSDPAGGLLAAPILGSLLVVAFSAGFGLMSYGDLGERVSDDLALDAAESPVSEVVYLSEAMVVAGEFDAEEYGNVLPDSFSAVAARDDHSVYEDEDEGSAVAIKDGRLVFAFQSDDSSYTGVEAITHVLDAEAGDVDRFTDRSEDGDWALRNGGNHAFVFGGVGDESDQSEGDSESSRYDPAKGVLKSVPADVTVSGATLDIEGDELVGGSADYALFHTGDPIEKSEVEDAYEGSDADVSASVSDGDEGGQRVRVSAEYTTPNLLTPGDG